MARDLHSTEAVLEFWSCEAIYDFTRRNFTIDSNIKSALRDFGFGMKRRMKSLLGFECGSVRIMHVIKKLYSN